MARTSAHWLRVLPDVHRGASLLRPVPHRIAPGESDRPLNGSLSQVETSPPLGHVQPGANRPFIISPWTWLISTSAGVLVAVGLVLAAHMTGLMTPGAVTAKAVYVEDASAPTR